MTLRSLCSHIYAMHGDHLIKKKQQTKNAVEPIVKICTMYIKLGTQFLFQATASEVDSAGGMAFKQNGLFDVSSINTQLQTCSFLPAVHCSIWW